MSRESLNWLNNNVLVGFTEKRGVAWHYKKSEQGEESNHYPGAIPVEDVIRRLFNWEPVESEIYVRIPPQLTPSGVTTERYVKVRHRKCIIRSDALAHAGDEINAMGLFTEGYAPHPYREWLINNVANMLDGDLGIGSAGLLRDGARAWVQVEVPDNIVTPEGVTFRPHILAYTSFDGSLATTYRRSSTIVVCDNTLEIARRENGAKYTVKHTKGSTLKIANAREALNIIYQSADDFTAQVARLCRTEVSDKAWRMFLSAYIPYPENRNKRGMSIADRKRGELNRLYMWDDRAAPWQGTAYGVIAAVNTFNHHYSAVRKGTSRADANMDKIIKGLMAADDRKALDLLDKVLTAV
jgi:phage/plasmid-related protein TIGR03299